MTSTRGGIGTDRALTGCLDTCQSDCAASRTYDVDSYVAERSTQIVELVDRTHRYVRASEAGCLT